MAEMWPIYAVIAVVVLIIIWAIAAYNGLVRLRNQVDNAWSQIDVQLKRRHDLIPNVVETVKGYAGHEKGTLEAVTKARNLAMGAKGVGESAKAEQALSQALSNFFVVVEKYPELKADRNFSELQEELASTENKIGFSRQLYNDTVMQYNTARETVPTNIVAGMGNFPRREFFQIEDKAERNVPKVSFS